MMDLSESQSHFVRIISISEEIEQFLDAYLFKKSFYSKVCNFLFNDSFASYHRFRVEITARFSYEEFTVKTPDNESLDL